MVEIVLKAWQGERFDYEGEYYRYRDACVLPEPLQKPRPPVAVTVGSAEGAMNLMIKDAFQEQTEAENKWRRLNLSSVQLSSYFTGFTQIYSLRNEIKSKKGDAFNLKEFHEQFLSYGNAPVKHIRELMLKE